MTAEFRKQGDGLRCQKCDAELQSVYRTRQTAGFVLRERLCPSCNTLHTTGERILNARPRFEKRRFSDPCE
jgi:transcriptional regulator NrdR family protein